jgi:Peroxidase
MRFCNVVVLWLPLAVMMIAAPTALAFQQPLQQQHRQQCIVSTSTTALAMSSLLDRRNFGQAAMAAVSLSLLQTQSPQPAQAQVFFDPAQYGDQELRVGAVDSLRESVRRAILKKPDLAPSFFQLALLDALSYNAKTDEYGPDGSIIKTVLSSKNTDAYTTNLKECCLALIEAEKTLKRKTAITLADAIAVGGGEAIESIGGPVLPVQLGRADTPSGPQAKVVSPTDLPLDLFAGTHPTADIVNAFTRAGLTEREMTVLMSALLTLEIVEKTRSADGTCATTK